MMQKDATVQRNKVRDVTIIEVGPRDGLQNIAHFIPTNVKSTWINLLANSGIPHIEVTSFVSADKIPQMQDAAELASQLTYYKNVAYDALVPNLHGLDAAILAGNINRISLFTAASDEFCINNINCNISQSLERFAAVMPKAAQHNIQVRAYISCVFGCPYMGATNIKTVCNLIEQLFVMGVSEISLGDTIGVATKVQITKHIKQYAAMFDIDSIAIHLHDDGKNVRDNLRASLDMGICKIDSANAGLGGCPYAPGAKGNIATEDVISITDNLGLTTGVSMAKLATAKAFILENINAYQAK